MPINKLIRGDNLEILKQLESETVDLIYLDPPFFSNRNYEVIWGEVRSFADRWSGGMDHYIGWLKERVEQMHRILKPTGSIFLHCDWHANAYIRVEILDKLFGYSNFNSEIIWERTTNSGSSKGIAKKYPNDHDTIYFYNKSNSKFIFINEFREYSESYIKHYYIYDDNDGNGKYQVQALKTVSPERLQELKRENRIVPGKGKILRFKDYLKDKKGVPVNDMWIDIQPVNPVAKERIGYPTQKPEALLKRIIEAASNEGDVVLDPFVGGGTTIAVAYKLQRQWIGIDQSVQAIKVTEFRLNNQQDLFSKPFIVQLHKYDYDTLRYKDAFEFESWIVSQFGGTTNTKQRGDLGLDGKAKDGAPIQVKRSDGIGCNVIDNFLSAVQRFDKKQYEKNIAAKNPVGYIIAFSFGKGAIEEVARLKNKENVIIKLMEVGDIVPIAKKPSLTVEVNERGRDKKNIRELEFVATGQSEAGIEFYSWDFDYNAEKGFKPEVIIDKQGKQHYKFKPGQHTIAVKVVDNDGLDNLELIRLKVNGTVERS
ncbi:MAG: DNA methyltransferase [Flammeovirgaceae bacterium]